MHRSCLLGLAILSLILLMIGLFWIVVLFAVLLAAGVLPVPGKWEEYWYAAFGTILGLAFAGLQWWYAERKRRRWARKGLREALAKTRAAALKVRDDYYCKRIIPYFPLDNAGLKRWSERAVDAISDTNLQEVDSLAFEIDHYNAKVKFLHTIAAINGVAAAIADPTWKAAAWHPPKIAEWCATRIKEIDGESRPLWW